MIIILIVVAVKERRPTPIVIVSPGIEMSTITLISRIGCGRTQSFALHDPAECSHADIAYYPVSIADHGAGSASEVSHGVISR